MKRFINKIFFTLIVSLFVFKGRAQNAASTIAFTAGGTTANTKFVSVNLESSKNNYSIWGIEADGIWYSSKTNPYSFKSTDRIASLGIYYKGAFSITKNFSFNFLLGGSAGSDNSRFIYYPFLGLEQNFYLSQNLQLTVNEKVAYLMGFTPVVSWQPGMNIGFKIAL